jgi:CheY-like chemotaxis protein
MVGSRIDNPEPSIWLLRAIVAGTVLLSLLYAGLYLAWGAGPALAQAPWYNPMMFTFLALTCVCVAFLAFGRYGVLRDPVCFWIGMGFLGFTIGITFYVLTWPGLLPDGRSVIAHRTNTPAFLSALAPSLLVLVLLVAALADGPGGAGKAASRWPWLAAAWLAFVTLLFALVVAFERRLPVLVTPEGAFTPMLLGWNTCLLVLFAAGAVLSIRRYRLLGNALLGYTAFFQIALFFSSLSVMIGDPRAMKETAGFGLFSIRERVELLGGRMKIRSAPGRGSTLLVIVPHDQIASEAQQTRGRTRESAGPSFACGPKPAVQARRLRVLVADDHEVVRQGLRAVLEEAGIEVVGEAANGREAVNLAVQLEPDVVIMDVTMPLIHGDGATRQIRKHLPEARVVALSMYDEPETRERMRRAGAQAYILKTAPSEELLAAIRGRKPEA